MPFYEYECSACKFYVEALQKISDPPLKKCPSCGKDTLQRLISAPVFRLKGSGWYETDFKSDKENKRNLVGAEDKEPAAKTDGDDKDKKVKVRASKALKKVAARRPVKAPAKNTTKKSAVKAGRKVGRKAGSKVAATVAKKKRPAKKKAPTRAARKPVNKKSVKKIAKKK